MKNTFTNLKQRVNWKTVVIAVISVALVAAIAVLCVVLFNKKDKDKDGYVIADLKFEIGGLYVDGTYLDTDASLYTKEAIEAESVKVTVDFDASVKYNLYFYDKYDNFVSASEATAKGSETVLPEGATHFRVVLTPVWGQDVEEDDQKVTIFNKGGFIKQITVSIVEPIEDETPDTE